MYSDMFAFSAHERGYNHIKVNKVCEDASDFYSQDGVNICVVADGHGSDNYPRTNRGAEFAVEASISCILNFVSNVQAEDVIDDEKNNYDILTQLAKSILNEWYEKVDKNVSENPFCAEELISVSEKYRRKYLSTDPLKQNKEKAYGCTLLAYVCTEKYSFGLQIGDGKCVVVKENGTFDEPIPWDDNCQLNITTSICDSNAIDEFRFFVSEKNPVAVFCGTDGIDDSYSNENELHEFYRSILKIFADYGKDIGEKEIKEYLPTLTKKGSGDDVSVGLIIDINKAKRIRHVLDLESNLFKEKNHLNQIEHKLNGYEEKQRKGNLDFNQQHDCAESVFKLKKEREELLEKITRLNQNLTKDIYSDDNSSYEDLVGEKSSSNGEVGTALAVIESPIHKYEIVVKDD